MPKYCYKNVFDEKLLKAKAVFGLFPANTINDDIEVIIEGCHAELDSASQENSVKFLTLRQQLKKPRKCSKFRISRFYRAKRHRNSRLHRLFLCHYRFWNRAIS